MPGTNGTACEAWATFNGARFDSARSMSDTMVGDVLQLHLNEQGQVARVSIAVAMARFGPRSHWIIQAIGMLTILRAVCVALVFGVDNPLWVYGSMEGKTGW